MVSLVRSKAHAFSIAARCREAAELSAGRQRLHARNPATSAAAVVSKNTVLLRNGRREEAADQNHGKDEENIPADAIHVRIPDPRYSASRALLSPRSGTSRNPAAR